MTRTAILARYIDRAADVARRPTIEGDPGAHVREAMADAYMEGCAESNPLRWVQSTNNPRAYRLVLGSGPNEVTVGRMLAGYDHALGHAIMVSAGEWAETARWNRQEAAEYLCRHLGIDPPVFTER